MKIGVLLFSAFTALFAFCNAFTHSSRTRSSVATLPSPATSSTRRAHSTSDIVFKRTFPVNKIHKTNDEWKQILTPEQFKVLREKGTERPWTGDLSSHNDGVYKCAACGLELFDAKTKFDSGTGWPSFFAPIENRVETESDVAYGMRRTEVLCAACESHLGHVFEDGPAPTGLRYCMNGVALQYDEAKKEQK